MDEREPARKASETTTASSPKPLRKEVYDGNINRTKQNDASSVHHLTILVLQKRTGKDKVFTESKTIKQNMKMKKRILGAVIIAAMAFAASWNFNSPLKI